MIGRSSRWFAVMLVGIFCSRFVTSVKLKLASEHDCDRHSLEALYYEKYSSETTKALTDITEFSSRSLDLMMDSLIRIMADLPGRESSGMEERKIFLGFSDMKKKFERSVNKMKNNITSAWESLMEAHHSLMLDDGKFSLSDVLNRTIHVADTYASSRSFLDSSLGSVISSLKSIVRDSMQGISSVVEKEIQTEAEKKSEKSNDTSETDEDDEISEDAENSDSKSSEENENEDKEKSLKAKKKKMTEMLAPGFLGKVTNIIVDRDVDLREKDVTTKSEDRDSVLDDIYFIVVMTRSRVNAIIHKDAMKSKESRDLARRSLYIYFADRATDMYKDRLRKKPKSESDEDEQPWKNVDDLADEFVNLMEQYP